MSQPRPQAARAARLEVAVRLGVFSIAAVLFGVGLLAVLRIQVSVLWLPTLIARTWGHGLVLVTVLLAAALLVRRSHRSGRLGRGSLFLCGAAGILALVPGTRVFLDNSDLSTLLRDTFGDTEPRSPAGARHRPSPVALLDCWGISSPAVTVDTLIFHETPDLTLELDLYRRPDADAGLQPLVVVVHGGSWHSGDRGEFPALNEYLAARGYAVAAIDYRLAPTHRYPSPVEDVHRAIAYLRSRGAELGIDGDRVVLIGRSAGGQIALAAAYGTEDRGIRGVVGFYAPTDMIWSWDLSLDTTYIEGRPLIRAYMGGLPDEEPELYRAASPLFLARSSSPPTLLLHGAADEIVSPLQSKRLAAKLEELGVRHLHVEVPAVTHCFDAGFASPAGQVSTYAIERFLAAVTRE